MRMVLLTNIVSPHQLPLAKALADRLGNENFRYIATEGEHNDRTKLGWLMGEPPSWVIHPQRSAVEEAEARRWCNDATILLSGLREFDLFRQRAERGLKNFYMSERWCKPQVGFLRMLYPGYLRMARKLWALQRQGAVVYLPMGIHAAEDMARISGFFSGGLMCLFRQPRLMMTAKQPLAPFVFAGSSASGSVCANWLQNMRLWGYFVEPGEQLGAKGSRGGQAKAREDNHMAFAGAKGGKSNADRDSLLRVLWVGRMLNWKRADTLIKAVVRLLNEGVAIRLKVVGYGPEEKKLRRLAGRYLNADSSHSEADNTFGAYAGSRGDSADEKSAAPGIVFGKPVPIVRVRGLMREADVVVLSSDGGEGWGSVVNEAMAEGCCVIGTREAGSSATMIEHGVNGLLYQAGNVSELAVLLRHCERAAIRECGERARKTLEELWSPAQIADRLLEFASQRMEPLGPK
ncbi:MAG: glycosyltransferase family 4 protein [Desulfobulbaceae bacterium]